LAAPASDLAAQMASRVKNEMRAERITVDGKTYEMR
jgi:hypothetical protein